MLNSVKNKASNSSLILYPIVLAIYVIYFFCLINIIAYNYGIILSLQEDIFYILSNLGIIILIIAFTYLYFVSIHYHPNNVQPYQSKFLYLLLLLIVALGWIFCAMSYAMNDMKLVNTLKNWYEYFSMYFEYVCCFISTILCLSFMTVINHNGEEIIASNSSPKIRKMKSIILQLCSFATYQIFFFCIINIIIYYHLEVMLTIDENISWLLLNIFFNAFILSFFYLSYYYKNSLDKKEIFNEIKYWIFAISLIITLIIRAMIFVLRDAYNHESLKSFLDYLGLSCDSVFISLSLTGLLIYNQKYKETKG